MAASADAVEPRPSPAASNGNAAAAAAATSHGHAQESGSAPPSSSNSTSLKEATPKNGVSRDAMTAENTARSRSCSPAVAGPGRQSNSKVDRSRSNGSEPGSSKRRSASGTVSKTPSSDNVPRLSAAEMQRLTNAPDSLPVAPAPQRRSIASDLVSRTPEQLQAIRHRLLQPQQQHQRSADHRPLHLLLDPKGHAMAIDTRPPSPRTVSSPPTPRVPISDRLESSRRYSFGPADPLSPPFAIESPIGLNGTVATPSPLPGAQLPRALPQSQPSTHLQQQQTSSPSTAGPGSPPGPRLPSPPPNMIPVPPMSLPTHLQLELAAQRPSPLYIHHSHTDDMPYESAAVKLERLQNVLLLPLYLERTLCFGALACLDAWLHTFTILPIRFVLALAVLAKWWVYIIEKEARWLVGFVWFGLGRLWSRRRGLESPRPSDAFTRDRSRSRAKGAESPNNFGSAFSFRLRGRRDRRRSATHADNVDDEQRTKTASRVPMTRDPGPKSGAFRHRRTKSLPSTLSAFHKADLLQGAVIVCSSLALMTLDASRMYHFVRAQSAIKLYVIFNILEVGDRLLSSLGQDILECLFSAETLSRNSFGRSRIFRPLTMFVIALVYNCLHSIALYYQVITLNVAVNSYSNALLTLLLSNQFVEIKSTVFKRFDRDSVFQLTCADIVERFQLWVMLLIIGMRNVVEVGGLSVPGAGADLSSDDGTGAGPLHPPSLLPHSFTVLPSWLMSGEVLSPFLIVVGSEMLVDAIKHAYVTKFNNVKPAFYGRSLDILCKDYYANAFTTPALTRRLGLAVIPLSCLFIRASVQTYHMFLSTKIPMPMPQSTQTSLSEESAAPSSPAMAAALSRFDALIRDSLGRATYGYPYGSPLNSRPWYAWTSDDVVAALTMVVVFFMAFLILLILKLVIGMVLLQYARNRYAKMKTHERAVALGLDKVPSYETNGRRVGCRPEVELGDDRQRWINADPTEGLPRAKLAEGIVDGASSAKKPSRLAGGDYQGVFRYEMVSKQIW